MKTRCLRSPLSRLAMLLALPVSVAVSDTNAADRDTMVRNDRDGLEDNDVWIYNDLDRGFAEAKGSGRPLMVVLRCIP